MNERALKRLSLENSLRRALEREEFTVHYQPQVRADNEKITGMEALVRWQHPELGLVPPAEFIPIAEDTGLIAPLGEWVLRTACAQNSAWQKAGLEPLRVSVNLSLRQFQQTDLIEMVKRALLETGLNPGCLELELTESSMMHDAAHAIETLRQLREIGIKISIDDFGSGYSSLSYLKHLPIDVLKIDRLFVRDMTTDPNNAAIVMAIITLAHNLNLKAIAEGVETAEQWVLLRRLNCDEIQGYLFSKPLPAEAFERLFRERQQAEHTKPIMAHR
jgi:EAL domain-containing protein (putative c-di-GMP-specific phosphodiesterase class I)